MSAALRVGFDASPLARPHSRGLVRVAREVLTALERRRVLEVVRLEPPAGARLASWRQRALPAEVRTGELLGIHSFVSAFPLLGPGRRVQTVHELPWLHGVAENADLPHRFWARLAPLRADRVLVASEHVARQLRRGPLGRARARRVLVCPFGVGPPFAPEPPPGEVDEPVLERFRLPGGPFALAVGATRAKKGLERLLAGLAELLARGTRLQLVVTGPETPELRRALGRASRLGLARYVSTPGEPTEEELARLYRLAALVPVLSHSEGFGLPVLEALASGTPAVVPRDSAQAEVAGLLGITVDADDPASVADGLARALAERESLRYRLPARADELSWDACAARVEAVWKELA